MGAIIIWRPFYISMLALIMSDKIGFKNPILCIEIGGGILFIRRG